MGMAIARERFEGITASPPAWGDVGAERVRIIGLVSQHLVESGVRQQVDGLRNAGGLAGREDEPQEIAEPIDEDVELATQAAARAPDGLILSPPLRRRHADVPGQWCYR